MDKIYIMPNRQTNLFRFAFYDEIIILILSNNKDSIFANNSGSQVQIRKTLVIIIISFRNSTSCFEQRFSD